MARKKRGQLGLYEKIKTEKKETLRLLAHNIFFFLLCFFVLFFKLFSLSKYPDTELKKNAIHSHLCVCVRMTIIYTRIRQKKKTTKKGIIQ